MQDVERQLLLWQNAGVLDDTTATSIRAYEAAHAKPGKRQWQVLIVLVLGGTLLGAGVLLFVAAHWEMVSPLGRLLLVLSMLVFFHGLGLLVRERFTGLATALHALGTLSAGAAIALVGQIFNMQEHWPSAVLLWALCAAAGWVLLRDQFQQTLTLLLVPAWIVSEWTERTDPYGGASIYLARVGLVLGAVYLVAWLDSRKRAMAAILFGVGALLMPISIGSLAGGWNAAYSQQWGFVPLRARLAAFGIMTLVLIFGWFTKRSSVLPAAIAAPLACILPWLQTMVSQSVGDRVWKHSEPNLMAYLLVAGTAVFLVWWGMRALSKAVVNYGVVAFAMTVLWFYFSSVMDKLGRSLGLITLGALFLAGGWALEQTRRKLVHSMVGGVA